MKKRKLSSSPEDFIGVEALMGSCERVVGSKQVILDAGYCTDLGQRGTLLGSASRLAVLQMLADKGVARVSSHTRYEVAELAKEARDFHR